MKEIKYSSLFSPIKVNNLMIKNRIIAAPMGIPKAQLLSSTYYGGISLPDKAKGGSGAIVVNELGLSSISKTGSAFDKYARDVTRETLSLLEGDGAVGVIEFGFHPIENDDGTIQAPSLSHTLLLPCQYPQNSFDTELLLRQRLNISSNILLLSFRLVSSL